MSLRDELKAALKEQALETSNLKIDKDYERITVHVILNGDAGPVFFDTSYNSEPSVDDASEARLVAQTARTAYNRHIADYEREAFSE